MNCRTKDNVVTTCLPAEKRGSFRDGDRQDSQQLVILERVHQTRRRHDYLLRDEPVASAPRFSTPESVRYSNTIGVKFRHLKEQHEEMRTYDRGT